MFDINEDIIVKIRTGQLEDAKSVLEIQKNVVSEEKYLITVTEEFNKTPDQQREWIQKILENERETLIIAEMNGEIVGWIVFFVQNRKRLSHVGSLGMMISEDYRGMGIGKLLVKELLDWAKTNRLIEKVSLGVFSTNQRAISMYKRMGFVEEGRKVNEIKINENEYVDDIQMYKLI
ncbi:GNAT family N-acetyltransferase [Salipaludibacillus neizhouensis]|uniref:GNAT family N-acetyltransferase n=1 Tax=Salipaludibacillus neizhouensis TaxID=885475 RepID=A0A3A9K9K7_9BACI|nr:GNAT family N-acetyltransferase [Salipaludibacillus neizhouensis]RKL67222.1 GNAT family N-acetyltransferase [Salipaludibacillus neizhouensis]